jgi:hypothetical protein
MTWQLLEERRTYQGTSKAEVAAAFAVGLEEALAEGYLPTSLDWQSDDLLVVTYEYDPKHAPRPLQRVRREP